MLRNSILLFSALLGVSNAHALAFSSSLQFKITQARVTAKDFQDYLTPETKVLKVEEKIPVVVAAPKKIAPDQPISIYATLRGKAAERSRSQARIFVVDEESLLNGIIKPISQAYVSFITPEIDPDAYAVTSKEGLAKVPYALSESLRFFVRAKDYMMGMGYATFGNLTVVPMVSKRRFSFIAKSLTLRIPSGQLAVFGRLQSSNLKGIAHSQVKFRSAQPQMFYSGPFFGGIPGYFTESNQETDLAGSFVANGVPRSLHSIQILNSEHTIPGYKVDFSGIPESIRFISLAFQTGPALNISSSVLDEDTMERPDCGLQTIVSNHTKPAIPDEEGNMWIESKDRPTVNDLKVNTEKCDGYMPTFLSQASHPELFPPTIDLFSEDQIQKLLSGVHRSWSQEDSFVSGHVYPQKEFKHPQIKEVSVSVVSSSGEQVPAEILYLNSDSKIDLNMKSTDAHLQNFVVLGLEDGEYHFVYRRAVGNTPTKERPLGVQVVRIKHGGVTQVDF
jgi:hypothetical protein